MRTLRGEIDARGVSVSSALLELLVTNLPIEAGHAVFQAARFDEARFEDGASFERVVFRGGVSFARAKFRGEISFEGAVFGGYLASRPGVALISTSFEGASFGDRASFAHARFEGEACFNDARFGARCTFANASVSSGSTFERSAFGPGVTFAGARFGDEVSFGQADLGFAPVLSGTTFGRDVRFVAAKIGPRATFAGAEFGEDAHLEEVEFGHHVTFDRAHFAGNGRFADARFGESASLRFAAKGNLSFDRSEFASGLRLGPCVIGGCCSVEGTVLAGDSEIELDARKVVASGMTVTGTASLRLRFADVVLRGARFDGPTSIAWAQRPFVGVSHKWVAEIDRDRPPTAGVADDHRPRVLTLEGTDVRNLVLADLDLSACRFSGSHNLDRLLIEGPPRLPGTPRGLRIGRALPPIWFWTKRLALVEEHWWRSQTRKSSGWTRQEVLEEPPQAAGDPSAVSRALQAGRAVRENFEARFRVKISDEALITAAKVAAQHLSTPDVADRAVELVRSTALRYSTFNPLPAPRTLRRWTLRSKRSEARRSG